MADSNVIASDEAFSLEARPNTQADAPDNAPDVAEALFEIERAFGQITPVDVVEAARDPASPLHGHFEWQDTLAAEQWRLAQARTLIASVRVKLQSAPERPPLRAFVHIPVPVPHYESAKLAMADDDKRAMILRRALGELESFKKRYSELSELAQVFAQIDALPGVRHSKPEPPRKAPQARAAPPQSQPVDRGRVRKA